MGVGDVNIIDGSKRLGIGQQVLFSLTYCHSGSGKLGDARYKHGFAGTARASTSRGWFGAHGFSIEQFGEVG